jgi:hypothetical protein
MLNPCLQTLCRAICATAAIANMAAAAPSLARNTHSTAPKRIALTYNNQLRESHITNAGYNGPRDNDGKGRPGDASSRPCWNCAYDIQHPRQFLPGDMSFTFQPVSGTFNYHF